MRCLGRELHVLNACLEGLFMAGLGGSGGLPGQVVGGVSGECDECYAKLCRELSELRSPDEVEAGSVWFEIPRLKALLGERRAGVPRATIRVQGETDSMGCELHDLCGLCAEEFFRGVELRRATPQECDWCKEVRPLAPVRDYDEGLGGPVYEVCDPCRVKQQKALEEELAFYDDAWDDDGWDDPYDWDFFSDVSGEEG